MVEVNLSISTDGMREETFDKKLNALSPDDYEMVESTLVVKSSFNNEKDAKKFVSLAKKVVWKETTGG